MQIRRFQLNPTITLPEDPLKVPLPKGAKILSLEVSKGGNLFLYAMCSATETAPRTIRIFATEAEIPNNLRANFIGTALGVIGQYTLHLFEEITGSPE